MFILDDDIVSPLDNWIRVNDVAGANAMEEAAIATTTKMEARKERRDIVERRKGCLSKRLCWNFMTENSNACDNLDILYDVSA